MLVGDFSNSYLFFAYRSMVLEKDNNPEFLSKKKHTSVTVWSLSSQVEETALKQYCGRLEKIFEKKKIASLTED